MDSPRGSGGRAAVTQAHSSGALLTGVTAEPPCNVTVTWPPNVLAQGLEPVRCVRAVCGALCGWQRCL